MGSLVKIPDSWNTASIDQDGQDYFSSNLRRLRLLVDFVVLAARGCGEEQLLGQGYEL